jgi:hypothetical protein
MYSMGIQTSEEVGTMAFEIVQEYDTSPQMGTDGVEHATLHGYDGGGQYSWDCYCGAGESDYGSDDDARLVAAAHLANFEVRTEEPA